MSIKSIPTRCFGLIAGPSPRSVLFRVRPYVSAARIATFKVPKVENENNQHYAKGSIERASLEAALEKHNKTLHIPRIVNGNEIPSTNSGPLRQLNPSYHSSSIATYTNASPSEISTAISLALAAKPSWSSLPFAHRASIFLKAADLISTKYRHQIIALTMLGQGKTAWQAEIDAAAELADFLRFNVQYAEELYAQQPVHNSPGVWNRVEYRALEGFVYAISPFNFTAIGGNLACAPALMGNVVIWKPSPSAMASNYLIYQILREAGLPDNVIQFLPGDAEEVTKIALRHEEFGGLHFTGSTNVFRHLYGEIAKGVVEARYRTGYPRIVAETGGKNFHLIHPSADIRNAVINTIRGAFEYQGQKCSACSRVYIPKSLYPEFSSLLIEETQKLKVGAPTEFENFIGPVIHAQSFQKLAQVIEDAKTDPDLELLTGGTYDHTLGYFIHPTIYLSRSPTHKLLSTELFGPILTVYIYDDSSQSSYSPSSSSSSSPFTEVCSLINRTSPYALTGSIFARSRPAIHLAESLLRNSAGNFYINTKCTGAVVGQQPFGGARASGTNDKAGSQNLLGRFVSMRAIKEEFVGGEGVGYPSKET